MIIRGQAKQIGVYMLKRIFVLSMLLLALSLPLHAALQQDTLILNTLNQINNKMDKLIDDLSNTNQRISRLEEKSFSLEKKTEQLETHITVLQEGFNKSRGILITLVAIGSLFGIIITAWLQWLDIFPKKAKKESNK